MPETTSTTNNAERPDAAALAILSDSAGANWILQSAHHAGLPMPISSVANGAGVTLLFATGPQLIAWSEWVETPPTRDGLVTTTLWDIRLNLATVGSTRLRGGVQ